MVNVRDSPDVLDTAFRQAERYFKARGPRLDIANDGTSNRKKSKSPKRSVPPELPDLKDRGVIDLSRWTTSDAGVDCAGLAEGSRSGRDVVTKAGWQTDDDAFGGRRPEMRRIELRSGERMEAEEEVSRPPRTAWLIGDGLLLVPQYVSAQDQLSLLESSLSRYTLPPNPLNLTTHYDLPVEGEISLFDLYAEGNDRIIPTIASRIPSTSHDRSNHQTEASFTPSVDGRRDMINNLPASQEGYEVILEKVKAWKGDEPSSRLKAKTAKALMEKELRWANLGWVYNWTNKAYDFTTSEPIPFPSGLRQTCIDLVRSVPWETVFPPGAESEDFEDRIIPDWHRWPDDYAPDTGIVNFYQSKDTLMGHVDRSELDPYRPLVSISLGHAAIFLVGGTTRHISPIPVILRSGDALIMAGKARSFYHGVPRIMEGTLPAHFEEKNGDNRITLACKRYISSARININARQVFPAGFKRETLCATGDAADLT